MESSLFSSGHCPRSSASCASLFAAKKEEKKGGGASFAVVLPPLAASEELSQIRSYGYGDVEEEVKVAFGARV